MNVKELRENKRITQEELAHKLGVSLRTVQNWEGGRAIPAAMEKLLLIIKDGGEVAPPQDNQDVVSIAAGATNRKTPNLDIERFFSTIERQQELMSRQLEEMAQMRLLTQKKDEQIDMLLNMIQRNLLSK